MKTLRWILCVALIGFSVPASAGERTNARRIARAEQKIQQAPVPSDAVGAAYTRDIRFSWIPFYPPFGAFGSAGYGVAFDRDSDGYLSNPRIVRRAGVGVTATIGIGVPWSISQSERVLAFQSSPELDDFASKKHVTATVKAFAAVGVPGKLFVADVGHTFGHQPGGTVVWKRDIFVGLFASAGGSAEVNAQWPKRTSRRGK